MIWLDALNPGDHAVSQQVANNRFRTFLDAAMAI